VVIVEPTDSCPSEDQLISCAAGSKRGAIQKGVLLHVDECSSCRFLLAEICRSLQVIPAPAGSRTLAQGDLVADRYRIARFMAEGGMGEVYLAEDCLLDEWVALKTLACTALDDARAAFRFKAEARLARKVTHPNVCRILEYGIHVRHRGRGPSEPVPFLTMEFLAGETLARRAARRGRLSEKAATAVLRGVLAGLQAIHACGIVHRDLKSENVFLVPHARGERVLVMDFGLARALDGSVPPATAPTKRMLLGTLDTMAPEQLEGQPPTTLVDVYALGVLLFELLIGRRPFVDLSPSQRRTARVPRPSSLIPELRPGWDEIVLRCLETEPRARFSSVGKVKEAIDGLSIGSA
jgi:serine/threonine protein kinase